MSSTMIGVVVEVGLSKLRSDCAEEKSDDAVEDARGREVRLGLGECSLESVLALRLLEFGDVRIRGRRSVEEDVLDSETL